MQASLLKTASTALMVLMAADEAVPFFAAFLERRGYHKPAEMIERTKVVRPGWYVRKKLYETSFKALNRRERQILLNEIRHKATPQVKRQFQDFFGGVRDVERESYNRRERARRVDPYNPMFLASVSIVHSSVEDKMRNKKLLLVAAALEDRGERKLAELLEKIASWSITFVGFESPPPEDITDKDLRSNMRHSRYIRFSGGGLHHYFTIAAERLKSVPGKKYPNVMQRGSDAPPMLITRKTMAGIVKDMKKGITAVKKDMKEQGPVIQNSRGRNIFLKFILEDLNEIHTEFKTFLQKNKHLKYFLLS